MITFYIIRHGKTILNQLQRIQGWCDSPLISIGKEEAAYLGKGLKDIHFEAVYTSDLQRTKETASIILKNQGQTELNPVEEKKFREVCYGCFEGCLIDNMWKEIANHLNYPTKELLLEDVFNPKKNISYEEVLQVVKKIDHLEIAEDFKTAEKRAHQALNDIAHKFSPQSNNINSDNVNSDNVNNVNIMIVSHGTLIKTMLHNLGGKELLDKNIRNSSVSKLIHKDGKFLLESLGDLSYMENGKK